ncbi:MAG: hypothetical protein K2P52_04575 [Campylobacterales bacterium]|nr:hypothetical protein [Campylobacterales bacterium]
MSGCSILTQGYVDSKPQIEKLEVQKSTKKDLIDLLGEPAILSLNLNGSNSSSIYKYYYKTSTSNVDTTLLIKGNYIDGCKNCGEITVFMNEPFSKEKSILVGLSVKDDELIKQYVQAFNFIQNKNFKEASEIFKNLSSKHFIPSPHTLALMYLKGDGVNVDYAEGISQNINKAKELYIKAAKNNYPLAIQELIKIYQAEGNSKEVNKLSEQLKNLK